MVYQVPGSGYVMSSTILINPPITSDRRTYWVRNVSLQALARNTNLICGGGGSLAAGPGTEQQLLTKAESFRLILLIRFMPIQRTLLLLVFLVFRMSFQAN
jgi:hypothetical protein